MAQNFNLFDIAFSILAPELKGIIAEIRSIRGISKASIRAFEKDFKTISKQLPRLKGTDKQLETARKQIAKTLNTSEANAFAELLRSPGKFADALGKLSVKERRELGTSIADATGGVEEQALSSSWMLSGIYEQTAIGVGQLTITTKQGKSYDYPGVPELVWEQMKAAKGRNGSGAGSVFWALYLRKFNRTRARARTSIAFRLAF